MGQGHVGRPEQPSDLGSPQPSCQWEADRGEMRSPFLGLWLGAYHLGVSRKQRESRPALGKTWRVHRLAGACRGPSRTVGKSTERVTKSRVGPGSYLEARAEGTSSDTSHTVCSWYRSECAFFSGRCMWMCTKLYG